jgi:hypothetical protein
MSRNKGKHHPSKAGTPGQGTGNANGAGREHEKPKKRFWRDYASIEKLNTVLALCAVVSSVVSIGLLYIAKGAFTISKDALRDVQRAFVFVKSVQITGDSLTDQLPNLPALVIPTYENTGDTPAKNFRLVANMCSRNTMLPDDFSFPDFQAAPKPLVLGPRATTSTLLPLDRAGLHEVYTGRKFLYVWGWVRYDDVFGTPHRLEFCEQFRGLHFQGPKADITKAEALFDLCQRHNCEDEGCPENGWGNNSDPAGCPPQAKPN